MNKQLIEIAKRNSYSIEERGDLETRNSDSEDFIEMSVWSIKAMLEEAYELGKKAAKATDCPTPRRTKQSSARNGYSSRRIFRPRRPQ